MLSEPPAGGETSWMLLIFGVGRDWKMARVAENLQPRGGIGCRGNWDIMGVAVNPDKGNQTGKLRHRSGNKLMTNLGKYEIIELIGSGAYAEVYKAMDTILQRTVALKLLKGALLSDSETVARFLQEARTAANLTHPHIAWVWDLGELDGRYYLAMRYIDGQPLDKVLKTQGRLSWAEAIQYMSQLSDALTFAHAGGLVHRDIKPQNIMISPKDGAVLTDFGLVRAMEAGSIGTRTGALMGTPAYMAPEIWQGEPAGPAADQYSLACVLVEVLTGRPLFGGPTPPAVMRQHLLEGPQLPDDWAEDLSSVVRRALSRDPAERFADMVAFKAVLQTLKLNDAPRAVVENIPTEIHRPPAVVVSRGKAGTTAAWTLEDGLSALKDMEEAQDWQLAAEQLAELEAAYPNHPKLKLPHKKITQVLETQREAEEKVKREADERARLEAKAKAEHEAEERARRETAAKAKLEADERAKLEAEEHARREAEAKAQREAEELARREAEAKAKREVEERAKSEADEKARRDASTRRTGERIFVRLDSDQEMEFIRIPAGKFLMGSDPKKDREAYSDEQPQHTVELPEYWIGRAPVTNAQYAAFVLAGGGKAPPHWRNNRPPQNKLDHPVVNVSWEDAVAYCAWLGRQTGQKIGLPTEAHWEKAARGTDGRIYPWGIQKPDAQRCNYYGSKVGDTTPVGRYSPAGDSPYGCVDMAGNVFEWCADWFDASYYAKSPASDPSGLASGEYRVVRGGSWYNNTRNVRAAIRFRYAPGVRINDQGFRCLLSP